MGRLCKRGAYLKGAVIGIGALINKATLEGECLLEIKGGAYWKEGTDLNWFHNQS